MKAPSHPFKGDPGEQDRRQRYTWFLALLKKMGMEK
jgi:hypothetical protein